jgi:predicted phage gp36 major capsid-like protein
VDSKTRAYVARIEAVADELNNELSAVRAALSRAEEKLAELDDLDAYKEENARLVAAMQEIADGRGKYAKVAKKALGQ